VANVAEVCAMCQGFGREDGLKRYCKNHGAMFVPCEKAPETKDVRFSNDAALHMASILMADFTRNGFMRVKYSGWDDVDESRLLQTKFYEIDKQHDRAAWTKYREAFATLASQLRVFNEALDDVYLMLENGSKRSNANLWDDGHEQLTILDASTEKAHDLPSYERDGPTT
jgi:hypothetical protein